MAIDSETVETVKKSLTILTIRENAMLDLRVRGSTLREIGRIHQLSVERTRQILAKSILRIRFHTLHFAVVPRQVPGVYVEWFEDQILLDFNRA